MATSMPMASVKAATRRPIDGVLLLDKPIGPSSTRVLSHVKHLLGAAKAGHGGTLDPMASGLLPLMFGEATKYAAHGLDADKTYEAVIALGRQTTTADREGDVLREAPVPLALSNTDIDMVLQHFRGSIEQLPPMFSALKKDGRALYSYARAGETVERTPRRIHIHELSLLRYEAPMIHLRVACSKGTYIRSLAEDIGAALGLPAHLHDLRRVAVGELQAVDMVQLADVEASAPEDRCAFLKPVDWLIRDWPEVVLGQVQAQHFTHGQSITISELPSAGGATPTGAHHTDAHVDTTRVRVKNTSGVFLGTGRVDTRYQLYPERLRVLSS